MDPTHHIPPTNEINLRELFRVLWNGKILVFFCVAIGLLAAVIYLYAAPEKWTSEAILIKPNTISMNSYMHKQTAYFRLGDLDFTPVQQTEIRDNAFNTFLLTINSRDMQENLISQTPLFKNLSKDMPEENKTRAINSLVSSSLSIFNRNPANPDENIIRFSARSGQEAQETLSKFLKLANAKTVELLDENLNDTITNRILLLRQMAESKKLSSEQTQANRIALIKQARDSAHNANINTPYSKPELTDGNSTIVDFTNPDTLFLLGEKNLSAQLRTLQEAPTIYPTSYYALLDNASKLETLLKTPSAGTMYQLTKAPATPLFRDSPRTRLSLVLGFLAGLFVSVFIILIRFSANYQSNRS